jgi:hypothetical protein
VQSGGAKLTRPSITAGPHTSPWKLLWCPRRLTHCLSRAQRQAPAVELGVWAHGRVEEAAASAILLGAARCGATRGAGRVSKRSWAAPAWPLASARRATQRAVLPARHAIRAHTGVIRAHSLAPPVRPLACLPRTCRCVDRNCNAFARRSPAGRGSSARAGRANLRGVPDGGSLLREPRPCTPGSLRDLPDCRPGAPCLILAGVRQSGPDSRSTRGHGALEAAYNVAALLKC